MTSLQESRTQMTVGEVLPDEECVHSRKLGCTST